MNKINSAVLPGVSIQYDNFNHPDGNKQVDNALAKLAGKANGRSLLQALVDNANHDKGRTLDVKLTTASSFTAAFLTEDQLSKYKIDKDDIISSNKKAVDLLHKKKEGTSATVSWNPEQSLKLDEEGRPTLIGSAEKSYLVLAHELVHAYQILKGTYTGGFGDRNDQSTPAGKEEFRAVGLGKYKDEEKSENGVRKEQGEPIRKHYTSAPVRHR